jgi:hypothetical protein
MRAELEQLFFPMTRVLNTLPTKPLKTISVTQAAQTSSSKTLARRVRYRSLSGRLAKISMASLAFRLIFRTPRIHTVEIEHFYL